MNIFIKTKKYFLLLTSTLFFSGLCLADDFLVEVILFRNVGVVNYIASPAAENWAAGADLAQLSSTSFEMRNMVYRLKDNPSYEVLVHKSFVHSFYSLPKSVYFVDGEMSFGRYPIEAKFTINTIGSAVNTKLNIWVNEFDSYGLVASSESMRQEQKIKLNKVYYIDQENLGMLIKVKRYAD